MTILGLILTQYQLAQLHQDFSLPSLAWQPPPTIASYLPKTARLQAVEEELVERDIALQLLRDSLVKAQDRMKVKADKRRNERQFVEGGLLYLKL